MKMLVIALIGGVVIGFVDVNLLGGTIQKMVADPSGQGLVTAGVAAFLGVIWGWVGKGVVGTKAKE